MHLIDKDGSSDSRHTEGSDLRKIAMGASLAIAVVMLVGKLTAYHITGSTAILSDAFESIVHLLATGFAAMSLWYAAIPPDWRHPYGHGKIAYFSGGFEGILILIAALGIIYLAILDLVRGPELERLGVGILVIGALTVVNLGLGVFLVHVGKKQNAFVLVANGHHVLTDMWTSAGVVVGVALVWLTDIVWIDPIVALLVGGNILWTAIRLLRQAYEGLMEKVDEEATREIVQRLDDARGRRLISSYHQLRHRRVNDVVWIDVHLLFPGRLTINDAHRRANMVEKSLKGIFPKDNVIVTSHLEPEEHDDAHPGGHSEIEDPLQQNENSP